MTSTADGVTTEPPTTYPADLRAARVQSYLDQLDRTAAACAKAIDLQTAGIDGDHEMVKGMPGWRFPDHTTGLACAARTQRLTMLLAMRLMDPPRATPRYTDWDRDETEPPDTPGGRRPTPETLEPPDIIEPLEPRERLERERPDFERLDTEAGDPDEARQFDEALRDVPVPDIIAGIQDRLVPKAPPPRRRRLPPRNRPLPPAWNYSPGYTPPIFGPGAKAHAPIPPPTG